MDVADRITLCKTCADVFYADKEYKICRADIWQTETAQCSICLRPGYDYFVEKRGDVIDNA